MPRLIAAPTVVPAAGDPPKVIKEFVGRVNSATESVSVAVMESPEGWQEPGQTPAFDEYTVVLDGRLVVESHDGPPLSVAAGQAVHTSAGQWVRYSTPDPGGARYVAVCRPAFSPDAVHRDAGHRDAGHRDAGHRDAGHRDAGHRDAGHRDAGHRDAPRGKPPAGYRRESCSPSPSGSATPPTPAS